MPSFFARGSAVGMLSVVPSVGSSGLMSYVYRVEDRSTGGMEELEMFGRLPSEERNIKLRHAVKKQISRSAMLWFLIKWPV